MLGWLADEADKAPELRPVMKAAQRGNVLLITSALALIEVIWLKPAPKLTPDKERKIRDFFNHTWIVVADVDRRTGEFARQLVWDHKVRPKDAVYVATAILRKADYLDTFDEELINLSGKVGGNPPLVIGRPHISEQLELELSTTETRALEPAEADPKDADEPEAPDEPDV